MIHASPWTALLLWAFVLGCADRPQPAPPPTALRLVDLVADAEVRSARDLDVAGDLGRSLVDVPLDPATTVVHRAAWVRPFFLHEAEGTPLEARVLAIALPGGGPTTVCVALGRPAAEDEAYFAGFVGRKVEPADLADPAGGELTLRQARADLRALAPGSEGANDLCVLLDPHGRTTLLVCAVGVPAEGEAPRVTVVRPDRTSAWLVGSPPLGGSPYARRIDVRHASREAIVLGAPGSFRSRVRLPAARPRLEATVFLPFRDDGPHAVRVEVDGAAARVAVRLELSVEQPSATIDLDLAALAGQEAQVLLAVEPVANQGSLVAFTNPVIVGAAEELAQDVVILSLDTVRADRTSLHGNPRPTTPRLNELAREAVVFDVAVAAAPWTLPSHMTLFSGQYPDRHGVVNQMARKSPEMPWLPSEFRAHGYETLAWTGSGFLHPQFGFAEGFERYGYTDVADPPAAWAKRRPRHDGQPMEARARRAADSRAELLDRIRAPRRRPLFLFVHSYVAHNYHAPPAALERFGATPELVELYLDGVYASAGKPSRFLRQDLTAAERAALADEAALIYDATLTEADRLVGDVVRALREGGHLDRTVLLVTSDHGEELFDRAALGHGKTLHEEQIRVPFVLHVPGWQPRRIAEPISQVDLAPTLRRLFGFLSDPEPVWLEDGASLIPLVLEGTRAPRSVLSRGGERTAKDPPFWAIRGRRLKLMDVPVGGGHRERRLYDLILDPGELHSLADERPAVLEHLDDSLQTRLDALRALGTATLTTSPDEDVLATLRELGYLGDG